MSSLIAAELLKLRRSVITWGLVGTAAALGALRMVQVLAAAGTAAGVTKGTTTATLTMIGACGLGLLLLPLLGATAVSGEFRHSTITATFLNTPHRRNVVIAKCIANAAAGAVLALGLVVTAVAVALVTGLSGPFRAELAYASIATVLGAVFLTWLGVGVGLLVRNQTVALLVPLVWFLVVEPMTQSFGLRFLAPWLPGTLTGELGPGGPAGSLSPGVAALTLTLYVLAMALLGTRRLERADIA